MIVTLISNFRTFSYIYMFSIHFLSFRYKFREDKIFFVFITMCFVNFARHLNPTMSVIKAVVYSDKHQTSPQQLLSPCGWEQPWPLRALRVCYLCLTESSSDGWLSWRLCHWPAAFAFAGDCVGVVIGSIRTSQALFVLLSRAALTTHRTHNTVLTRWHPGVIPGQFTTRKCFLFALGLPCLWLFISLCCPVGSGPWVWRIPSFVSSRTNPLPTFELVLTSGVWKVHFCFQFVRDGFVRLFSGLTELSSFRDLQVLRLVFHFSQFLTSLFLCSSTFFCAWRASLLAAGPGV